MRLTPLVLIPLVADLTFLFLHAISREGGFWKKRMEDSDVVGAFQRLTSALRNSSIVRQGENPTSSSLLGISPGMSVDVGAREYRNEVTSNHGRRRRSRRRYFRLRKTSRTH